MVPGQGFVIIEIRRKRPDKNIYIYINGVGWESDSGQGFIYEGRGVIKEKNFFFLKGVGGVGWSA